MKIILKKTVEHVGEQGAVVDVRDGYARNYLFPRGWAEVASKGNLGLLGKRKKMAELKVQARHEGAQKLAEKIRSLELTLAREAGLGDKLHGAVTAQDIVEALAGKGVKIDKHVVFLEDPIHKLGRFTVPIRLHRDVEVALRLWVVKA